MFPLKNLARKWINLDNLVYFSICDTTNITALVCMFQKTMIKCMHDLSKCVPTEPGILIVFVIMKDRCNCVNTLQTKNANDR